MKAAILLLVIISLLLGLFNVAHNLGFVGDSHYEYKAFAAQQMDALGFRKLAEANGIEVGEGDRINFPKEMRDELYKFNMLPYTIAEIEKEGWRFITATSDDHYLFRKRKAGL